MRTYLYNKKIMNLITYYRNIYVNNCKFSLIVNKLIVLQLSRDPIDSQKFA